MTPSGPVPPLDGEPAPGGTEPSSEASVLLAEFDRLIRRDPARRGLIESEQAFGPLCPGHLADSAAHLAQFGQHVILVTGFYVPEADQPAAETDGPLGTALLAAACTALGMRVTVVTDDQCARPVELALRAFDTTSNASLVVYDGSGCSRIWTTDFFRRCEHDPPSHLISVERVGPSHTADSVAAQLRSVPHEFSLDDFHASFPLESHGLCHNMRGLPIDAHSPSLYSLFEMASQFCPGIRTIGIGDGGNEIGMGAIAWEDLVRRLTGEHSVRIPCRIATHWTIVAGTSNWGAYALAAGAALLAEKRHVLAPWTDAFHEAVLEKIVREGPAVDGITRRAEQTVDGLPFLTYIQPWVGIRRLLELD